MTQSERTPANPPALVVDLDGTLTLTDTLYESLLAMLRRQPASLFLLPVWLAQGRAYLKAECAVRGPFCVESLPYHDKFLRFLQQQRDQGRTLVLATAANRLIATRVAEHLGLFSEVIASDTTDNLKSTRKLQRVQELIGAEFEYAGDSRADLPLWNAASAAIIVGRQTTRLSQLTTTPVTHLFAHTGGRTRDWWRAVRIHQWLKNLLLLVPLLTSFSFFDAMAVWRVGFAFLSFSLGASGTYVLNDLWDLQSDRSHPRKRFRPFAAGELSIPVGALAAGGLIVAGGLAATAVSWKFTACLASYLGLSLMYNLVFKSRLILDVVVLALLYTLRVFAGAVAIDVRISSWLLVFSVFMFFSLALIKRCTELLLIQGRGHEQLAGRAYRTRDLAVLWPLGVGSALCAVTVLFFFIHAPETQTHYQSPQVLWFVPPLVLSWVARVWLRTSRGEMHDDPIVDAMRDQVSYLVLLLIVTVMLVARFYSVT
ncbi:MAG: hypothetical protein RLZZ232_1362 [Planctomycetota bacterium]|jgi:4-hydroxybenzoate polyprenyltransferase/phosphoserine phosphatase